MRTLRLVTALLPVFVTLCVAAPAFAIPALQDLTLDPNPILPGGTSFGTVTLSEPAAGNTTVTLSANPANGVSIPPTVTVLTGQTQAAFQIDDLNVVTSTTISATLAAVTVDRDLDVVSSLPHLMLN